MKVRYWYEELLTARRQYTTHSLVVGTPVGVCIGTIGPCIAGEAVATNNRGNHPAVPR